MKPAWKAPQHVPGTPIRYVGSFQSGEVFHLEPGDLAKEGEEWWLRCPCGNGGVLDGHTVSSTEPVEITPSIVCPAGCHYHVQGGRVV